MCLNHDPCRETTIKMVAKLVKIKCQFVLKLRVDGAGGFRIWTQRA